MTTLLEDSVGRKYMFNNLMNIRNIVGKCGEREPHEALEVLAVSCRGVEPREFKHQKIEQLNVFILVY